VNLPQELSLSKLNNNRLKLLLEREPSMTSSPFFLSFYLTPSSSLCFSQTTCHWTSIQLRHECRVDLGHFESFDSFKVLRRGKTFKAEILRRHQNYRTENRVGCAFTSCLLDSAPLGFPLLSRTHRTRKVRYPFPLTSFFFLALLLP
jgi:hypothetical protein